MIEDIAMELDFHGEKNEVKKRRQMVSRYRINTGIVFPLALARNIQPLITSSYDVLNY